jgi:hypothetical protein
MWHHWLGRLLWCVYLGVLCMGCVSDPGPNPEQRGQELEVEPAVDGEPSGSIVLDGENAGATAITLRWVQPKNAANVSELRVIVQNTTDVAQRVQLVLSGTPPSRQEVIEQPWLEFVLGGRQSRVQRLPLSDMPVQSSVHPSGLRVVAQFSPTLDEPGAPPAIAFTEPRLLTFDGSFRTAHLRTTEEHSRLQTEAPNLESLLEAPFEVRMRNSQTGAFVLASGMDPDGQPSGVMIVRDVDPELVKDSDIHPHFPDTEVLLGDAGAFFAGEDF